MRVVRDCNLLDKVRIPESEEGESSPLLLQSQLKTVEGMMKLGIIICKY